MAGRIDGTRRSGRRRGGSSRRQTPAARPGSASNSWTRSRRTGAVKRHAGSRRGLRRRRRSCRYVDAARQGIAGASYGGYAVDWLIGHTNRFKVGRQPRRRVQPGVDGACDRGAVVHGLGVRRPADQRESAREQFAKFSPHRFAQNIQTPTLVITNELDFRVPVDQGLQLFTALRRNGVPSKALVFPGRGTLGPEGAQQQVLARDSLRLDRRRTLRTESMSCGHL